LDGLKTSTGRCYADKEVPVQYKVCGAVGVKGGRANKTHLENDELQLHDVVLVDPILCGLADKVLLAASCRGVSLYGIPAGADQVVEPR